MDGDELMIIEQPDSAKPWGLGCVICSRYAAWLATDAGVASGAASSIDMVPAAYARATFSVGSDRRAKYFDLQEFLQHVGRASKAKRPCQFHARAMEHCRKTMAADPDTSDERERDDVPTLSQFRICYDILKRVTPPLGKTYEVECVRAREAGDATAAARRGGKHTATKIAQSIAAALVEQDRRLLSQGIAAIGIAQDARKGLELTKVRFVTKSFDVRLTRCPV